MILILSNNDDWSTNDVVEWLHAKEAYFQRLNFDSLPSTICEISINNETSKTSIVFKDKLIDSQKIDIIWFRRSAKPSFLSLQNSNFAQNGFGRQLVEFVASESKYFFRAFFHAIGSNKKWLNNFLSAHNDKFDTLLKAQQLGIDIPTTFLTFSKAAALNFIDRQDSVIMKPIYNIDMFMIDDQRYMPYTKRVVKEDFDNFDENIFPILLQKEIKKKYEVRSFYLDGKFYSMAIPSPVTTIRSAADG
jgi:glutathione synthase/RimK-type ligase-like ATP-grasp enzyme